MTRRIFVAVLVATACGGGGDGGTTTPTPNVPTPAALVATSATTQSGAPGQSVAVKPSVKVTSNTGAAMSGVTVTFAITGGGGSLTGASATSDALGIATVGSWTLGPSVGANTMTATVSGLTPVTFTVNATSAPPSLTLTPALAAAAPLGTVAFTASAAVIWSVNGVTGGSAALGTVTAAGVYTAPATIPAGDSVVVTATHASDGSVQRSATIFFVPDLVTRDYYLVLPRVVDIAAPVRMRVLLVPPANVTAVNFVPTLGPQVALQAIGANVLTFTIEPGFAVAGYVSGTLHNWLGRFDYRDAGGAQVKLTNFTINVRDATMPAVTITPLAADAQRSSHILNIRLDTATILPSAAIVSRALQLLGGDLFDFVAVLATVASGNNRVYIGLRNDITGIGTTVFNNSAAWGGAGKLRGAIAFPLDGFFDGAEQGFMHEVGHSWINYASADANLAPGPHWPLSTMAYGTMGFNIAGSNVGGNFPYTLISLGNGTVRVNAATQSDLFSPLDLYLMGLIPPDQVPPMYILSPAVQLQSLADGQILAATTYTINTYIANQGPRVPSSVTAPKSFSVAVVVLSMGRLLTPAEMAFFNRAAARAETTTPLQTLSGIALTTASGFSVATGGRATMRTLLP